MSEKNKLLKPHYDTLSTALQRNNSGFEQERCDVVAYAIVNTVYDCYSDIYKDILNSGVDADLSVHGLDEIDTLELMLDAETHLLQQDIEVSDEFLRATDCDVGSTLLQISESLYREAFKDN
ncbi:hypothetical protein KY333_02770 [Candidatus Woesearchaeota archaeon]|nr:hypothetical protein [Candidatus Woesearchaeota archaeon]